MNGSRAANDDAALSIDDAIVLVEEIERLRGELAKLHQQLAESDRLAHCDPLVGLANRRRFLANLEGAVARTIRYGTQAAIIMADVDGLKAVNDTFGHLAGDKALVEISQLLVSSVRKTDCVARLSGDEFAILLEHIDELSAWEMALRVVETVNEHSFRIGQQRVRLSVAVGVARVEPGDTSEGVLARADKEMYRIKAMGPGRQPTDTPGSESRT